LLTANLGGFGTIPLFLRTFKDNLNREIVKKFLVIGLLAQCCFSANLKAQESYFYNSRFYESDWLFELGGSFGLMNCLTDLGGGSGTGSKFIKDINWSNFKPSYGGFVAATWQNRLGFRLEYTNGEVTAYDSVLSDVKRTTSGRYERYLNFKSDITEFSLVAEVFPLAFFKWEDGPPAIQPYILGGVGWYDFNPQGLINGQWVDLEPLRLEGQGFAEYADRKQYRLSQLNIPLGAGIKYDINEFLTVRGEFMYRILSTDYLDDVSEGKYIDPSLFNRYLPADKAALAQQLYFRRYEIDPFYNRTVDDIRGNSANNDAFFSFNLKVSITLGREAIKNSGN
jgi:hypothetical protein